MPGSTATLAMPYPLATEPVSQGDDAIKALAERVEAVFGTPGVAWTAYTPGLAGAAQGNGTLTGGFFKLGKTRHFWAKFVLGSTSTISGNPISLGLPTAARSATEGWGALTGDFLDSGTARYGAQVDRGTSVVSLYTIGANGLYGAVTPTAPFTWAAGDIVFTSGTYEAA